MRKQTYNEGMETHFFNRMHELADRAFREGRYFFSDFLSESECLELNAERAQFAYAGFDLFGGAEGCARQIARFGCCGCNGDFPVSCLKITPKSRKFAQPYTHRDLLGALLSLGIERSAIGDLIVGEDGSYAFCLSRIAPYLCENLTSVRHTDVVCTVTDERPEIAQERRCERVTLSSLRCDVTVCAAFRLSRADALEYFRSERVSLNGKICTENAKELKPGDCVAVRGKGKFYVGECGGLTRKGKYAVELFFPV